MNTTSRVLVAMGAVALMTCGSALAQEAPAQPPAAPPAAAGPAIPPAAPAADEAGQAKEAALTATGELLSVDAKASTMTIKTATGEITVKYDNSTKVSGASRNTAGLATMSGSQVVVRYKKDGASNVATTIEVKPAAAPALGAEPKGGDRPAPAPAPGGDPAKPPTPRP